MSTIGSKAARVFLVIATLGLTISGASALQIGPRITCCSSHGPNIGGYKPFERPIPDRPLDGLKQAIVDTPHALDKPADAVWNTVRRPFVETWKFLSDPLASWRRKAEEAYNKVLADATALAYQIVKWLSIGFGSAVSFAVGLAMGLAALLFRPKRRRHSHA